MDSTSGSLKIDKLTTSIFSWKHKVQLVLSYRELDEYIGEKFSPPTDPDESFNWHRSDRMAMVIIGLSLSDLHLNHFGGITCAHAMWRSILDIF